MPEPEPLALRSNLRTADSIVMPFDLASILVILTVGLVTPGPDMMIVLKNSLGGRARGLATVAGIALGLGLQTTLLAAAFTLLAEHTATIANVLRWCGAGVLVYFGARALLSPSRNRSTLT